jgi:hypothetical protein
MWRGRSPRFAGFSVFLGDKKVHNFGYSQRDRGSFLTKSNESNAERDEVLKRMLKMPPKPHKTDTKPKSAKDRQPGPNTKKPRSK